MDDKKCICEFEELIKARRFHMDRQKPFYILTFEKIKKALSNEYIDNIEDKITRWIDVTVCEYFRDVKPVEYYMLAKMLYRDGFFEAAIITSRSICEMLCYDILNRIIHPFGDEQEIQLVNFRTLLKYICMPKTVSKHNFECSIITPIKQNSEIDLFKSSYHFDVDSNCFLLKINNAKTPRNLNRFFSVFKDIGFDAFDHISRENYDIMNDIYDIGNIYVHSLSRMTSAKDDSRKVILYIGKVLYDMYGISGIATGYTFESAYTRYPDICSGITFLIEVFLTPESAEKGYFNIPSDAFIEKMRHTVGEWDGQWTCKGRLYDNVSLRFTLGERDLKATLKHKYISLEHVVKVKEKLTISLFQDYFHMHGYQHTLTPDHHDYMSNYFELEFMGDDTLIGTHKCDAGSGKAIFFRKK